MGILDNIKIDDLPPDTIVFCDAGKVWNVKLDAVERRGDQDIFHFKVLYERPPKILATIKIKESGDLPKDWPR